MLKLWPTASGALEAEQQRLDHVVDVAPGADLRAVAVDRQVAPGERRLDERADRAAADLARAVDVERADRHGRQPELVVVGVRHVLAGELRDRVRPARLADRADRRHAALRCVDRVRAEHLARRELDQPLERVLRRERRLEHVVRADHVHPHRAHRARAARCRRRRSPRSGRCASRPRRARERRRRRADRRRGTRSSGARPGRCPRARRGAGCRRRRSGCRRRGGARASCR